MQVSDWLGILLALAGAGFGAAIARGFAQYYGHVENLFEVMWNGLKDGLLFLVKPRRKIKQRRTLQQIEFNTSMTWAQIRWDIARKEHELLPLSKHTHDVADCVHPDCNPEWLRKMATKVWNSIPHDSYTCLDCGMTSYNPNDVREEYCGNCHEFKHYKYPL